MSDVRAIVAGGLGGTCFLLCGQPFDTIKVRMQNQRKGLLYQSSFDCFRKTVTKEGVSSLFKGMSAPLAFNIPASSLWFLGREHGLLIQQRLFNKRDHEMSLFNHGMAGLLAGVYMTLLLTPGERIKCILQLQTGKKSTNKFRGPLEVAINSIREGGVRQLFRGLTIQAWRDVPGSGLFFILYESILQRYGESPLTIAVAGGLSGMLMWLVGVPSDVVKTRYQTAPVGKYASFIDVIPELYRKEGSQAFLKGFGPGFIRAFICNGVCILTYELTMKSWHRIFPSDVNSNTRTSQTY